MTPTSPRKHSPLGSQTDDLLDFSAMEPLSAPKLS